ncbi:hypothetical protein TGAM01_v201307 [Trichoderma gamsii]|uniref:NWD NACHT-NTPase N-terminal domain-containing protein n=1 Tax=Trichoderma gamsii TaxID=398673 RepID=A0A2P5A0A2_9HYPO|nr:hypothetical protein TGAM01_v201307 [Trichoderma gamsii]PON29941.1 hypothetical protein TGAM01_v201307 [Trichoderma gamsii]
MERLRKFKGSLLGKSRKTTSAKLGDNEEVPSSRATVAPPSSSVNTSSVTAIVAQPASPDAASSLPSRSLDPWTRAYEMFQGRESELAADYEKHLATLQEDPQPNSDLSTPLAVESIVKQLLADREKKQWQVPLLGKDIKVREQVERLAKFVLWSDEIVKSALSAQPYAALAWSGVSMVLPLLTSGTKQNEAMLKGFNSISDLQVYWRISEKTYLQSSHGQDYRDLVEPLAKLYSHIVEYQARVICHLSSAQLSRAWQDVAAENDWDSLANEVNALSKICSDCIPPLREQELRQYRDNQLQEIKESQIILSEIRRILEEDGKQSQRFYEDQTERNLLRDLASDYESYKSFNTQRVPGTCEWFFNDDRFGRWRDSSTSSLLWVSAGPGCGKSVLSRALVDEQRLSTHVTTSTVCHFFFKDGDQRRMNSTNALCAILHQLFTKDPTGSLIEHALPNYRKNSEKLMENLSELWGILESCAKSSNAGEIICLLDALDECNRDSRMELIEQLKSFYTEQARSPNRPSKLKFLITSRPYDDLEASFRMFSDTATYLRFDGDDKSEQIGREINLVIDARICDIGYGLTDEGRRIISERLKSMENRTYLWLHLTFDIIKQSPSEYSRRQDIEKLLSDLPTQVSDAYEKILGRSKESEKTIALLQIMLAAARPLSLDEANVALTLALEKQWYTSFAEFEEDKWHDPESFKIAVKNLCGLLISVYDSQLFFLHQTVREFLTTGVDPQNTWKGRFNTYQSHSTLSLSCLRLHYLSRSDTSLNNQKYPFLSYAVSNWLSHYIENKILKDLEECHHSLWNIIKNAPRSKRFQRLENSHIYIAIIDNGVDVHSLTQKWKNISIGRSFVKYDSEDRYLPWFSASDPHGTQVASIIRKVNPFCHLYILKVGETHKDVIPENVAKAVNYAISHQVDIVSITCNAKNDRHLLREATKKAMSAASDPQTKLRPLIFCNSAVESTDGTTFPTCYGNAMTVAADNICGHLRPASKDNVDILVPGEDIEADAPADVKRLVSETMSSVAPALAAGIASLAILLLQTHNHEFTAFRHFLDKHNIMQVFGRMGNGQSGIQISQLFGNLGGDEIASRWKIANFS